MREDLRMDLRDGPRIQALRGIERQESGLSLKEGKISTVELLLFEPSPIPILPLVSGFILKF